MSQAIFRLLKKTTPKQVQNSKPHKTDGGPGRIGPGLFVCERKLTSLLVAVWPGLMNKSTNLRISHWVGSAGKRQKKGRNMRETAPCQHSKNLEEKMKRKKTKRKHQGCDVLKVIDGVVQAVSTAKKVFRAVEPIVKTIVAQRRKTK